MLNENLKKDIVASLKVAMTSDVLPNVNDTGSGSYYDNATGTLFCTVAGSTVSSAEIKRAIDYFNSAVTSMNGIKDVDGVAAKQRFCELAVKALEQVLLTEKLK